MQIHTKCPQCGAAYTLPADMADKRTRCESCWHLYKLPALEELDKPMRIIENSAGRIYVDEEGNLYG
ncbi:hypothetical protein [Anaerohalosphaera lusitana]|uniref:hypothetical protein n=1 Tax=Anaerohalosphaera lusitana TaxID=1936003 RepID=UPI0011BA6A03|nr:hypothetical protein [Anaerohalosphaera lusitana]